MQPDDELLFAKITNIAKKDAYSALCIKLYCEISLLLNVAPKITERERLADWVKNLVETTLREAQTIAIGDIVQATEKLESSANPLTKTLGPKLFEFVALRCGVVRNDQVEKHNARLKNVREAILTDYAPDILAEARRQQNAKA